MNNNTGPLKGLRVLDLSRILAGPTCTQILGDLGADVIKVERPKAGDDTRKWGPPYVKDKDGNDTSESAYYLCANRNKRSVTLNIAKIEGQELIYKLAAESDIFIENYKVGTLKRFGLDYETISRKFPKIIYCSISGFGQTGPKADLPGYDFMIQAMGGIMSVTGEADGSPMKVGVGIADVMCGMYATSSILAALHHRNNTGEGQYIDMSLLDTQVSWLINSGSNYLTSREDQYRKGNSHPNIVPYQIFQAHDGEFVLAVGNDDQFSKFCQLANSEELAEDPRFSTNEARVKNREELIPIIQQITRRFSIEDWFDGLSRLNIPCGPVNTIKQVFEDTQVQHRGMEISLDHPLSGTEKVSLLGSPIKMSKTPVSYRQAPPTLGQHTDEVLEEVLNMDAKEREELTKKGII